MSPLPLNYLLVYLRETMIALIKDPEWCAETIVLKYRSNNGPDLSDIVPHAGFFEDDLLEELRYANSKLKERKCKFIVRFNGVRVELYTDYQLQMLALSSAGLVPRLDGKSIGKLPTEMFEDELSKMVSNSPYAKWKSDA